MSSRLLLCVTLAATITVAGCTADTPAPPPVPQKFDASDLRLVAFDSCDQLSEQLRTAAKQAVGPWDFGHGPIPLGGGAQEGGARTSADLNYAAPAPAAKAAGPEFSGTNVHEIGSDEPDIVKTDGKRIVTIEDGVLRVVDVATHRQTGKLSLDQGMNGDLLLAGDKALVLLRGYGYGAAGKRRYAPVTETSRILLVDLTGAPRTISTFESEGMLVDARMTGGVARVVLKSSPRITFPDQPNQNDEEKRVEANRRAIDKADADAWLPGWTSDNQKGRMSCAQVSRPPVYSGTSMLSVHTFDLAAPALGSGDPVALVADGDTVYGTPTSLYVASDQRWRLDMWRGRDNRAVSQDTQIYRFDLPATGKPVWSAAGSVPGWLINQYALSEWDGRLRVATTNERKQTSAVRVLERRGDKLTQVGVADGLGRGERIYSVRFIGAQGYVVTFKQTDPLYRLDLSDPTDPQVTGELKITGYSAHLQPAGDGRLIGIGQEANTEGRTQGTQVSLFDVSDPKSPARLAQHFVSGGHSEAEYDPHALLYWPTTRLMVVPMTDYDDGDNSVLALRVTDRGIEDLGRITQPREAEDGRYAPGIRRSMVISDELWTMSSRGLQASSLSTLDQVGWVPAT